MCKQHPQRDSRTRTFWQGHIVRKFPRHTGQEFGTINGCGPCVRSRVAANCGVDLQRTVDGDAILRVSKKLSHVRFMFRESANRLGLNAELFRRQHAFKHSGAFFYWRRLELEFVAPRGKRIIDLGYLVCREDGDVCTTVDIESVLERILGVRCKAIRLAEHHHTAKTWINKSEYSPTRFHEREYGIADVVDAPRLRSGHREHVGVSVFRSREVSRDEPYERRLSRRWWAIDQQMAWPPFALQPFESLPQSRIERHLLQRLRLVDIGPAVNLFL